MPIYKYRCQECGFEFEKLVFGEEKIKCPKCKSSSLKKLISAPAGMLKSNSGDSNCNDGSCGLNCPHCRE